MKFDVVIIGGGLAALTSGIMLAERGKRCAIFSSGESALFFSSGSLDLLNRLPSGEEIGSPQQGVGQLVASHPEHPYAKLGVDKFTQYSDLAVEILSKSGVEMSRLAGAENHLVFSAMGKLTPTWLSLGGNPIFPLNEKPKWKRVLLVNFKGFSDFQYRFIADGLREQGMEVEFVEFALVELDRLRKNPTEMRSNTISNVFEQSGEAVEELLKRLRGVGVVGYDAVLVPAVFKEQSTMIDKLRRSLDFQDIFTLPTMPPSTTGIEIQRKLQRSFERAGGIFFAGHRVVAGEIKGGKVVGLSVDNHEGVVVESDDYILATGSFFGKGLSAGIDRVVEPIFGADVEQGSSRGEWHSKDLFLPQEFMRYGVQTTRSFNAVVQGESIENLYASGSILADTDPILEGSGGGVAMVTAIGVANQILSKR